jgi:hypothetical protein
MADREVTGKVLCALESNGSMDGPTRDEL